MAKVIAFAIQKGGVSKTTTAGITAHLLAEKGQRVLLCDMDAQGNSTEMVTGNEGSDYRGSTILEGIEDQDLSEFVIQVRDNFHLVPGDDVLASFDQWIFNKYKGTVQPYLHLATALAPLRDRYDYILIDTPPHLGQATANSLAAADYVVIPFEPARFCYTAVPRFIKFMDIVKKINPTVQLAGILRNMTDIRRQDVKDFNQAILEQYPDLVFKTVINRKATTGRVALYGLEETNPELADAVKPFRAYLNELEERINGQ